MAGNNVFAVPVFLVVFRESLEAIIIISILLAFLKQTLGAEGGDVTAYKKLRRQVRAPTAHMATLYNHPMRHKFIHFPLPC